MSKEPYELDTSKFSDPLMAAAAQTIIRHYLEQKTCIQDKSKISHQQKLIVLLTNLFSSVYVADITATYISEFLIGKNSTESLYIFRIVICLLDANAISDSILKRILDFRSRFWEKGNVEDFHLLMNSPNYEAHRETSELLENPTLFFFSTADLHTYESEDHSVFTHLIEEEKHNTKHTISTRLQHCRIYRKIALDICSKKSIRTISRNDIGLFMLQERHQACLCTSVMDFIDACSKITVISEDLKLLLPYKAYFYRAHTLDHAVSLCTTDTIQQYALITTPKGIRLYYTDIPHRYPLFESMKEYLQQSCYVHNTITVFVGDFYKAIDDPSVTSIENLSFSAFTNAANYYSHYNNYRNNSYLLSFFEFAYKACGIDFFERESLSVKILAKPELAKYLADGYEIVRYNPFEDIPTHDRWITVYSKKYDSGTEHPTSETVYVDFTKVNNPLFRSWCKYYFWKHSASIISKRQKIYNITLMLNYIHELRTGKVQHIYCPKPQKIDAGISSQEILAARSYILSQYSNIRTAHSIIYETRAFLKFIQDCGITKVPEGVFYHMYTQNQIDNNAIAIPNSHLEKLNRLMYENSQKSILNDLFYSIFYIALETEFRISQIVSLETDCIQESLGKRGEYVLLSRKKDPLAIDEEASITLYVKRHIEHVLEVTSNLRRDASESLKKYLFLVPLTEKKARKVTRENFRLYMHECCKQLNIPPYSASNLRDTHMTKAREFKMQNSLSDMEHAVLTDHTTKDLDLQHYVDISIQTIIEAMHGVIIGNVDLNGEIVEDTKISRSIQDEVSDGCGFCKSAFCNDYSYLDCMLCKNFVTTPSHLVYFQERLKTVDEKIKVATLPHDKEDLVNIKRLLLSYICAIKEFNQKKEPSS